MTGMIKWLAVVALALPMLGWTLGCEDKGPAEQAGEKIDEAAEDVRDAFKDAADDVEDAFD